MWMCRNERTILWEPYIEAAREAWWHGQHERAGWILVDALRQAEECDQIDATIIRSIESLARQCLAGKNYAQAEWLQKQVLETFEKFFGPESEQVVRCYDKLAVILEARYAEDSKEDSHVDENEEWTILEVSLEGEDEQAEPFEEVLACS